MPSLALPLKIAANTLLRKMGYEIRKFSAPEIRDFFPIDFDDWDKDLWAAVAPHTMTSLERIYSLRRAVEYVTAARLPGAFVECGVWKGGSSLAMVLCLQRLHTDNRELFLYDTFDDGWPAGDEIDVTAEGVPAHQLWLDALERGETADTLFAKYDNVRDLLWSTGYPRERLHFIKGKVEDTIPGTIPEQIALLRLDTDWYSSTKHELEHLYPRLVSGGVLMIDDYASFAGARQATDEYFEAKGITILLHRVDDKGYRIGIKP